jgi:hypothetical protein
MNRRRNVFVISIAALVLAVAPAAFAGKGGGGKQGGGGNTGSGGLSLVLLNSTDGLPHWGQDVTFKVSTTADRPFVTLNCYVDGAWLYSANVGFFPDYPWPQRFTLSNGWWTSGPADCTATLYTSTDGSKSTTLAQLSFHVYA